MADISVRTSLRRSPLGHWTTEFDQLPRGVRIAESPFLTMLTVRLDPAGPAAADVAKALGGELPTTPCTFVRGGEAELLWLGPDEWLVVAAPGATDRLTGALRAAFGEAFGTVTDVSAQRTTLDLTGPLTRDILARGCAVDLHPRAAPAGTCVQTLLARTGVVLQVRDDTATAVRLLVRASFAPHLAAWLVDACAEYW
jgi:sarcosine oxidase subunit gamma